MGRIQHQRSWFAVFCLAMDFVSVLMSKTFRVSQMFFFQNIAPLFLLMVVSGTGTRIVNILLYQKQEQNGGPKKFKKLKKEIKRLIIGFGY